MSEAFKKELQARTGVASEFWGSCYSQSLADPLNLRSHPVALRLLRESGPEWSEGQFCRLRVARVEPQALEHVTIHEYDGLESPGLNLGSFVAAAAARAVSKFKTGGAPAEACLGELAAAIETSERLTMEMVFLKPPHEAAVTMAADSTEL